MQEWQHMQMHWVRETQCICKIKPTRHTVSGSSGSTEAAATMGRRTMGRIDQRTPKRKAGDSGIHHDRISAKP